MKRGQTGIALVILGVIAIIAVIGLVLLFTRASKEAQGAALLDLSIGNTYGGGQNQGEMGISPTYPTAEYYRSQGGANQLKAPAQQLPGYPSNYPTAVINTKGSRTPAFIVSGRFQQGLRSGFAALPDLYACETDMNRAGIPVPHNQFNCYQVPQKGPTSTEAQGFYPSDSSAEPRPVKNDFGNMGGDMYCYANSVGAEQTSPYNSEDLIRENIMIKLVENDAGAERFDWGTASVNGVIVPVCWKSADTFPFPQ